MTSLPEHYVGAAPRRTPGGLGDLATVPVASPIAGHDWADLDEIIGK